MGFDNAHGVPAKGSRFRKPPVEHDHWHRTENDAGRPYRFAGVDQLLADFESKVLRVLDSQGVGRFVLSESHVAERASR